MAWSSPPKALPVCSGGERYYILMFANSSMQLLCAHCQTHGQPLIKIVSLPYPLMVRVLPAEEHSSFPFMVRLCESECGHSFTNSNQADPVIISVSPLYISEEGGHVTIKGAHPTFLTSCC